MSDKNRPPPPSRAGAKLINDDNISENNASPNTSHAEASAEIRHDASLGNGHVAGKAPTDELEGGMDVERLIRFWADEDGRAHLTDLNSFVLNASDSDSLELVARLGNGKDDRRTNGGQKQLEMPGALYHQDQGGGADADSIKSKDQQGGRSSFPTALDKFEQRLKVKMEIKDDTATKGTAVRNNDATFQYGTTADHIESQTQPSQEKSPEGRIASNDNNQTALDKFEKRMKMKLDQTSCSNLVTGSVDESDTNEKCIETDQIAVLDGSAATALDKFEMRMKMKLDQTSCSNVVTGSVDESDTNDARIETEQTAVLDGSAATALDKFEKRMKMKLDHKSCSNAFTGSVDESGIGKVSDGSQQGKMPSEQEVDILDGTSNDDDDKHQIWHRETSDANLTESADEDLGPSTGRETNLETGEWETKMHPSNSDNEESVSAQGGEQQQVGTRTHGADSGYQANNAEPQYMHRRRSDTYNGGPQRRHTSQRRSLLIERIPAEEEGAVGEDEGEGASEEDAEEGEVEADVEIFTPRVIRATLVEESLIIGTRVGFFERKWRIFVFSTCVLLVALAVVVPVMLNARDVTATIPTDVTATIPTDVPSMTPSSPPSFDPAPTLEIVRTRGRVRCGLHESMEEVFGQFYLDLCRSVAAVIFGNPESYVGVPTKVTTRFQQLHRREVDLLVRGDTHNIEREVMEGNTDAGFTFSSPYYYDGMAYFGSETHVTCAETKKRFDECTSLKICVFRDSTTHNLLQSLFPSDFIEVVSSVSEEERMLWVGECNVLAGHRHYLLTLAGSDKNNARKYIVGHKFLTKDPLAIVTRNTDHEFSDAINWVVQALFYGEEQGLTKNPSLCQIISTSHRASDLRFMNAVYCVGNYGELYERDINKDDNRGINRINNGTTGMLYATPFGELEKANTNRFTSYDGDTLLRDIRTNGSLNCGVVVPDGFAGDIEASDELVGMSVEYCRIVTAALFNGDPKVVNLTAFSENDNSSIAALNDGTIDVLAGGKIELRHDFGGLRFSTPYYYGNETAEDDVSFFSLATRDDSVLFSSFVNCVVLATIHAQENNIVREENGKMPLMSLFGSEFNWALRDAIAYSGSYDQIYAKNHFGDVSEEGRGRNAVNKDGSPQMHSFPGLAP